MKVQTASDDRVTRVLIAVVIFRFGAGKIPQFAKAFGQARKEFDPGLKRVQDPSPPPATPILGTGSAGDRGTDDVTASANSEESDPSMFAARKEGTGATATKKDQIAFELAWIPEKTERESS